MTKFQFLISSFHFPCCLDLCSSTMIQMDSGDRLRVTLLDRISTVESRRSLTLEAVLRADKRASPPAPTAFPPPPPTSPPPLPETPARTHANRTLLDVMRDEHRHSHDLDHGHGRDKTAWKSLREKLRLKRSAAVWTSSNPIPNSDTPLPNEDNVIPDNSDSNRLNQLGFLLSSNSEGQSSHSQTDQTNNADISSPSTVVEREGRLRLGAALAEERALSARETNTSAVTDTLSEVQPPRMSLMELLEENEGQIGVAGAGIYDTDEDGDGEENEERDEEGEGAVAAVVERGCCVCMVRNKGAAFIPCGHTFCRLCSRELWVQRGNCPLCNASILEILDIF